MPVRLIHIILIAFSLYSNFSYGQNQVSGKVFLDSNSNGILDANEKGIQGVCVSNGREVVQTDADGKWVLPSGNRTGIFVIKPANYSVPVNRDQIPQHYFLFQKKSNSGSSTQVSVNFPLQKSTEPKKFSALFFGDTQARGLREVNFINHDVVEECMGTKALFGVSLGDNVADGPGLFEEVSQGIAQIGIPWYNTFGNHDCDRDVASTNEKDKTFKTFFGPSTFAFEYGEVVFIDLNDIFFKPDGTYIPHFTDDQLNFVKNYLATVPQNKLIVLMMHAPIVQCDNRESMFQLIQDRKFTFSVSGHVHEQSNVFVGKEQGWNGKTPHHHLINATVCGSWWCGLIDETGIPHATMNDGAPNGYSVITFDGNTYSVRFKAARRPENYQMNIYLPEDIKSQDADTTKVLVNVFAGSERSKVEMRVGNSGGWITLKQVRTTDPECRRMHELSPYLQQTVNGKPLEDVLGNSMDKPSFTNHMWQAPLPKGISAGTHTVEVRTTDMYGQSWQSSHIFRVQ